MFITTVRREFGERKKVMNVFSQTILPREGRKVGFSKRNI